MTTLSIPWNVTNTVRCPSCGSLATEWHPDLYRDRKGWGHCHVPGCGVTWRMDDRRRIR